MLIRNTVSIKKRRPKCLKPIEITKRTVNDLLKLLSLMAKLIIKQLTSEQRVFMVVHYTQNLNATAMKNAYRQGFLIETPI